MAKLFFIAVDKFTFTIGIVNPPLFGAFQLIINTF